jgi:hypothetical protein
MDVVAAEPLRTLARHALALTPWRISCLEPLNFRDEFSFAKADQDAEASLRRVL